MKILKNIFLVFIGIFLSLVLLEAGLQTASYVMKTVKQHKINQTVKNKKDITILCLGESTTDGQWPPILQKILDKKSKNKKFNVIDAGKGGCDTNDIVNNISYNLEKYKPDIIVSMIGINDRGGTILKLKNFGLKTLKLLYLLKEHLIPNSFADEIKSADRNNYVLNEVKKFLYIKDSDTALTLLNSLDDNDLSVKQKTEKYLQLINVIKIKELLEKKLNEENKILYKEYILKLDAIGYDTLQEKINFYCMTNDAENIKKLFYLDDIEKFNKFVFEYFSNITGNYFMLKNMKGIDIYDIEEKVESAVHNALKSQNDKINRSRFTGFAALNYFIKKDYDKAEKYFNIQTEYLLNNIDETILKNYRFLAKICEDNNIKLIAMQYPVMNIKPLKKMLHGFDCIEFVDNEENFKEALKKYGIDRIFKDRFAGDFGHCTESGNTLIAENVAEIILKLYDNNI